MLDINQIKEILPHRYPFLLVDKIESIDEEKIVGIKNVTFNEPFFQGHFPQRPIMPGVLIVEAMAQVAGIGMFKDEERGSKLGVFTGIEKCKFRKQVIPGDVLKMEIKILANRRGIYKVQGEAFVDGKLAASANMTFAVVES